MPARIACLLFVFVARSPRPLTYRRSTPLAFADRSSWVADAITRKRSRRSSI